MAVKLTISYENPSHRYTTPLEGVQYEFRLTYRDRTASWYLDMWDAQGNLLLAGRRLSPNWSPQRGMITNGPPGGLFAVGSDPYARDEIELWYLEAAECVPVEETDTGLIVLVDTGRDRVHIGGPGVGP